MKELYPYTRKVIMEDIEEREGVILKLKKRIKVQEEAIERLREIENIDHDFHISILVDTLPTPIVNLHVATATKSTFNKTDTIGSLLATIYQRKSSETFRKRLDRMIGLGRCEWGRAQKGFVEIYEYILEFKYIDAYKMSIKNPDLKLKLDQPLTDLKLNMRIINNLHVHNIKTIQDLMEFLHKNPSQSYEERLQAIPGLGKQRIDIITDSIKHYQLDKLYEEG